MRIAVCDDDKRNCRKMKEILEMYGEENRIFLETEIYENGKNLCQRMADGKNYDLLFLDIAMEGCDGVEVGEYIRRHIENNWVRIIYIFHRESQAADLAQSQPVGFLKKPIREEKVYEIMEEIRKSDRKNKTVFFYKKRAMGYQVPYPEIIYFQSEGRKVRIRTSSQTYEYNDKLSQILENGIPKNFLQVHKSYIVNMDYVIGRTYTHLHLKDADQRLPISQIHRKEVRTILQERLPELEQEDENEF